MCSFHRCDLLSVFFVFPLTHRNGYIDVYDYISQARKQNYQVTKEIYSATLLCGGKLLVCGDKEHLYFTEVETGKQVDLLAVVECRLESIVIFTAM